MFLLTFYTKYYKHIHPGYITSRKEFIDYYIRMCTYFEIMILCTRGRRNERGLRDINLN